MACNSSSSYGEAEMDLLALSDSDDLGDANSTKDVGTTGSSNLVSDRRGGTVRFEDDSCSDDSLFGENLVDSLSSGQLRY
jgi:hypothetical protein